MTLLARHCIKKSMSEINLHLRRNSFSHFRNNANVSEPYRFEMTCTMETFEGNFSLKRKVKTKAATRMNSIIEHKALSA